MCFLGKSRGSEAKQVLQTLIAERKKFPHVWPSSRGPNSPFSDVHEYGAWVESIEGASPEELKSQLQHRSHRPSVEPWMRQQLGL